MAQIEKPEPEFKSGKADSQACILVFFFLKYSWFTTIQVYSNVIQLYIYTSILFFSFFSILGYYKILNILPSAVR